MFIRYSQPQLFPLYLIFLLISDLQSLIIVNAAPSAAWIIPKPSQPYYVNRQKEILQSCYGNFFDNPLRVGGAIRDRYQTIGLLGKGSFGSVVEAYDHVEHKRVAIKIVFLCYQEMQKNTAAFLREVEMMSRTTEKGCQFVMPLKGFFIESDIGFIVMPLMKSNLHDVIRKIDTYSLYNVDVVQELASQLTQGLACIHSLGIQHADLKPGNVMISSMNPLEVAISDFGSSVYTNSQYQPRVTYIYEAPEITWNNMGSPKSDMWSLGLILAEAFHKRWILTENDDTNRSLQIQCMIGTTYFTNYNPHWFNQANFLPPFGFNHPMYESMRDLIMKMIVCHPDQRISSTDALEHPFIASIKNNYDDNNNSYDSNNNDNSNMDLNIPPVPPVVGHYRSGSGGSSSTTITQNSLMETPKLGSNVNFSEGQLDTPNFNQT